MTPHTLRTDTPRPQALQFVKGEDGRYRAGAYVLGPGRVGFDIEVVDIFREGVHAHRTAGSRCLVDAMAWASADAVERGIMDKGQQALI